jgi:N-acetyl-anhydromuramyl-L-alanine amidase AmpD
MNRYIQSQNFSSRNGQKVLAVVCHITDGDTRSVIQTFTNPQTQVSSHYLIQRNGDIIQFVREEDCAWANGKKVNPTARVVLENINLNPNLFTISVEHEAFNNEDLTEIQYVASSKLIREICQRHGLNISREVIIGHREIRQDKNCPGKVSLEKLIGLTFNPPAISEIETLKIKISLLQQLLDLMRSLMVKKLGNFSSCSLSKD